MNHTPSRTAALVDWVARITGHPPALTTASADASFRRYFRCAYGGCSYIVMDAPPEHEDNRRFADMAARLRGAGLRAPEIVATDFDRGFLLLEDLGDTHFLAALTATEGRAADPDELYPLALSALVRMQTTLVPGDLPDFVETCFAREFELFTDWLLTRWLGIDLSPVQAEIAELAALLRAGLGEQPAVFVHRDFHSRNLMLPPDPGADPRPGILDFQDAVSGPLLYDSVSLLRDCYVVWPWPRVAAWLEGYRVALLAAVQSAWADRDSAGYPHVIPPAATAKLHQSPAPVGPADWRTRLAASLPPEPAVWQHWFDLTATQRHLKAAGIFARLALRDDKPGYLGDIPRTLAYIPQAAARSPNAGLDWLAAFITETVLPEVQHKLHDEARASAAAGPTLRA